MKLPRTTKAMMKFGNKINKKQLKIGDLVFFHTTRRYYHVGIYMGKNIFMHASGSRGISKSSLDNSYWKKRYIFSRRVL
jgi:cell wall-associated NlpC family hydrolase